jgi:3-isopropylmalate dehydratase small subunit
MKDAIRGRAVRLAFDDVNTDIIAPSEYRQATSHDDKELKPLRPHVLEAIRPGLDAYVQPGDVFVVGKNFGCGSHREPAVQIFNVWGVQAIIAESAARIWFRNAIAAGLPVFQLENATKLFGEGDQVEIDLKAWSVRNATRKGPTHAVSPFPPTVLRILDAGGIMPLLKKRIDAQLSPKFGLAE